MTVLEKILIFVLVCLVLGGSQSLKFNSKAGVVNQKTRRCSNRETTHLRDVNSNEKQSSSSKSEESDESDESDKNNLKAVQASADSTNEKNTAVKDTVSTSIQKEENSSMIADTTDVIPIPEQIEHAQLKDDDICWDFEKERCKELADAYSYYWRNDCESDEDCVHQYFVYNIGKCCEVPCGDVNKVCRYPIGVRDLVGSLDPEYMP
ncbi:uncharacterized protein LOC134244966 [Saccostrea cucullata]|uniref:uncharacterized protein LOC134244966 n=1 Tax=Saccostrea cuccullata TaxID=36930 RepID=UPI002ED4D055